MSLYSFNYSLTLDFDGPANSHHFLLRCFPQDNHRQRIKSFKCSISTSPTLTYCTDWAGNRIATGFIKDEHPSFSIRIEGIAETNQDIFEDYDDGSSSIFYAYPTPLTFHGESIDKLYKSMELAETDDPYKKALTIMRTVSAHMTYERGVTDASTTAEKACEMRKGVCQDYAHIMLALCHLEKLPAKYTVGLMAGEGKSHAWVEVLCRGIWYGFDPTNNMLVTDGYIKLSQGRDYTDCQINRGAFQGGIQQKQTVTASMMQLQTNQQ